MRGAEVRTLLAEAAERLGGPALGRGHPGVRAARAAPRADRGDRSSPAAVRADRRRPARPGRELERQGIAHLSARPLAGAAEAVPATTGRGGSCSRAASAAGTSARGRASSSGSRQSTVILEAIGSRRPEPGEVHLLFAGGIHDARSAAVVAALAGAAGGARGPGRRPDRDGVPVHRARPWPPARSSPGSRPRRCGAPRPSCWRPGRGTRSASARRRSPRGSRRSGSGCSPRAGPPRRSAPRWRG